MKQPCRYYRNHFPDKITNEVAQLFVKWFCWIWSIQILLAGSIRPFLGAIVVSKSVSISKSVKIFHFVYLSPFFPFSLLFCPFVISCSYIFFVLFCFCFFFKVHLCFHVIYLPLIEIWTNTQVGVNILILLF